MANSKEFRIPDTELTLMLPRSWEVHQDDDIISIFDPRNGLGVLQFSIYYSEQHQHVDIGNELGILLKDKTVLSKITILDKLSYSQFIDSEGTFWRYWMMKSNTQIFLISYNCALDDMGEEETIVDSIISSVLR